MAQGGAVVSSEHQVVTGGAHPLPRAMADLTRLLLRTEAKWRSMIACEHHRRPWRDGARPCSGVMGTHCPVASSQKHQDEKGKKGQEPDEREERSAALATEDHEGGGVPMSSKWGKSGNAPLP
jgi:hypothetical protein